MSYERSPREVCSTTMGTRFNPRSFIERCPIGIAVPCFNSSVSFCLAEARELPEARGLVDDLHLCDRPVQRLILEGGGFQLLHRLTAAEVLALGLLRVRIRSGDCIEFLLDTLTIDL